jgi:hypothetical protein
VIEIGDIKTPLMPGAIVATRPGEEAVFVEAPPDGAWERMLELLQAPTPPDEVKSRSQGGTQLSYVDARFCQDRLDASVGPGNWQVACQWSPSIHTEAIVKRNGEVLVPEMDNPYPVVGVGIWNPVRREWVWKFDIGDFSDIASVKGGYSDSFKRACVQWGIARDLYNAKSAARQGSARRSDASSVTTWKCSVHNKAVVIPAGTSAAGKPYSSFVACPEKGCRETQPKPGTTKGRA